MRTAAVLLASLAFVTTSDAATARSLTIRVYVTEVTQTVKDVPPKTFALTRVYTKGDTIRGTEILRNAVRQFARPPGAAVGSDRYAIVAVAYQTVAVDFVTRFPGGTLHAHGEGRKGSRPVVPIVGGTGGFAGARGSIEGSHLASGKKLNVYRVRLP
jgi:hypothetical protein